MAPKQASLECTERRRNHHNINMRTSKRQVGGIWRATSFDGESDCCSESSFQSYLPKGGGDQHQETYGRRVRFAVAVKKHLIINREEYTKEEWRECFYAEKEERKAAKKRMKVVARMEQGKKPKRGMTYRGLECGTEKGQTEFDAKVKMCVDAVMDEQDHQWYETKIDDYERIAQVCIDATRSDVDRAIQIGIQDEVDATDRTFSTETLNNESFTSLSTDDDQTVFTTMTSPVPSTPQRMKKILEKKKDARSSSSRRTRPESRRNKKRSDPPGDRGSFAIKQHPFPELWAKSNNTSRGRIIEEQ